MLPFHFQLLVLTAWLTAAGVLAADAPGSRNLAAPLRDFKATQAALTVASCKANKLSGAIRIALVLGYFISLAMIGGFVSGSREVFLVCSLGWSVLSYLDGPLIVPRPVIPFYEGALLLNGAVLALCFFSPFSKSFDL
jgi:hypothetical protein